MAQTRLKRAVKPLIKTYLVTYIPDGHTVHSTTDEQQADEFCRQYNIQLDEDMYEVQSCWMNEGE